MECVGPRRAGLRAPDRVPRSAVIPPASTAGTAALALALRGEGRRAPFGGLASHRRSVRRRLRVLITRRPGEAALMQGTLHKARFYLRGRQKGFQTQKSPLKLNSLDEGYANHLEKQNPTMFSKFCNSPFN